MSRTRLHLPIIDGLRRQINRLTVAYEPAISLIEILLDSSGVSLQGATREPRLPGFLFDMNRFFQRLLGRFLRENLTDHTFQEEKAIKGMMSYSPEHNPHARRATASRPDYCVKTKDGKTLLLDAKYTRPLVRGSASGDVVSVGDLCSESETDRQGYDSVSHSGFKCKGFGRPDL